MDRSRHRRLAASLLLFALVPVFAGAKGDPQGKANQAALGKLPSGSGLASKYKADSGIAAHPAVIFADGFERDELKGGWEEVRNRDGAVLSLKPTGDGRILGKKCLRATATLGKNTGGGVTRWFKSAPTLFIRFYTRFDKDSDYFHHFVTLRANKSLKGRDRWSGFGGAGLKPKGDTRFSTALEPWGNWGRNPAPGRWNFYTYWHEMSAAPDKKYWGNAFRPAEQALIKKGEWICCELMLKHNTPGKHDGEQAFWIDGELRGHWSGISWRTSPTVWANALTLESYVTDRWTKNKVNICDFDNIVVAKEYIGPSGH